MSTGLIVLIVVLVVLIAAVVALFILGKRAQKKQAEQQVQLDAMKQTVSLMAIDKKMLPLNKAGLPDIVIQQTPWIMRRSKLPIVKAKVDTPAGPRVMNMVADNKVFDIIPLKKQLRAVISGIYIMDVKAIRGSLEQPPKKQSLWQKAKNMVSGKK